MAKKTSEQTEKPESGRQETRLGHDPLAWLKDDSGEEAKKAGEINAETGSVAKVESEEAWPSNSNVLGTCGLTASAARLHRGWRIAPAFVPRAPCSGSGGAASLW